LTQTGQEYYGLTAAQLASLKSVAPSIVPNIAANSVAAAAANTAAFQAAVTALGTTGGLLLVTAPGTYWFSSLDGNACIYLPSNTTLFRNAGVIFKMAPNSNCNFVRNQNFNPSDGSGWQAITSITTTDGKTITVVLQTPPAAALISTTATKLINGALQDDYNGVFQITYNASGFTYQRDRTQGTFDYFTSPATFNSVTGVSATVTNNTAAVTVSAITGISPGMSAIITAGSATLGISRVNTLDSATQISLTGALPVCSGAQAVTMTFVFPLQCCNADTNIQIIGGTFDHNQTNQTSPDSLINQCINLRGVGNNYVSDLTVLDSMSAVCSEGIYDSTYENIWTYSCTRQSGNGIYPVKHSGRNVIVNRVFGSSRDDFVSIIGKEYSQYMDMGSPFGKISEIVIRDIKPSGCLSTVKVLPVPNALGPSMDGIVLENIGGRPAYTNHIYAPCYDPNNTGVYTSGTYHAASGSIGSLQIVNPNPSNNGNCNTISMTAAAESVTLSGVRYRNVTSNGTLFRGSATSNINNFRVDDFHIECTGSGVLGQTLGTITNFSAQNGVVKGVGSTPQFMVYGAGAAGNNYITFGNVFFDNTSNALQFNGQSGNVLSCSQVTFNNGGSQQLINNASSTQIIARFNDTKILSGNTQAPANVYSGTLNNSYAFWGEEVAEHLSGAATQTPDFFKSAKKNIVVNQATTIANPINLPGFGAGWGSQDLTIILTQSGGPWAVTWGSQYLFPDGAAPVATASGQALVLKFTWDGASKMICQRTPAAWV